MRSFAIKRFATNLSLASMLLTGATATYDFNLFAQAVMQKTRGTPINITADLVKSLFEESSDGISARNGKSYKAKSRDFKGAGTATFSIGTKDLIERGFYIDQSGRVRKASGESASASDYIFVSETISFDITYTQSPEEMRQHLFVFSDGNTSQVLDNSKIHNLKDLDKPKNNSSFTVSSGNGSITYAFTQIRYSWIGRDGRVISVQFEENGVKKYRLISEKEHETLIAYLNFMKDKDPHLAAVLAKFNDEGVDVWKQADYDRAIKEALELRPAEYSVSNGSGSAIDRTNNAPARSGEATTSPMTNPSNQQFIIYKVGDNGYWIGIKDASGNITPVNQNDHDRIVLLIQNSGQAASGLSPEYYNLIIQNPAYNQGFYDQASSSGSVVILETLAAQPDAQTTVQTVVQTGGAGAPNSSGGNVGQNVGPLTISTTAPGMGSGGNLGRNPGLVVTKTIRKGRTLVWVYDGMGSRTAVWMTQAELQESLNGPSSSNTGEIALTPAPGSTPHAGGTINFDQADLPTIQTYLSNLPQGTSDEARLIILAVNRLNQLIGQPAVVNTGTDDPKAVQAIIDAARATVEGKSQDLRNSRSNAKTGS